MNYAVIDLGSNTMRLSVYEYIEGRIHRIYSKKAIAGLALYTHDKVLDMAGIKKACSIINDFKKTAYKFVEEANLRLFASASLRNIENRDEAIKFIVEETSLTPDVLEGNEEAALGYIGASYFTNCENGVMIDIGGASTELVLFKDSVAEKLVSLPVGCLNLSVEHVSEVIPKAKEWKKIRAVVKEQLTKVDWEKGYECPLMVGIGGTLRAALTLSGALFGLSPEQSEIQASHVKEMIKRLKNEQGDLYQTIYKNTPDRLMTISTGLVILQQAIKKFGCEAISVSRYGLREGYLMDRMLANYEKRSIHERRRED